MGMLIVLKTGRQDMGRVKFHEKRNDPELGCQMVDLTPQSNIQSPFDLWENK